MDWIPRREARTRQCIVPASVEIVKVRADSRRLLVTDLENQPINQTSWSVADDFAEVQIPILKLRTTMPNPASRPLPVPMLRKSHGLLGSVRVVHPRNSWHVVFSELGRLLPPTEFLQFHFGPQNLLRRVLRILSDLAALGCENSHTAR